jgi:hypothetical protein
VYWGPSFAALCCFYHRNAKRRAVVLTWKPYLSAETWLVMVKLSCAEPQRRPGQANDNNQQSALTTRNPLALGTQLGISCVNICTTETRKLIVAHPPTANDQLGRESTYGARACSNYSNAGIFNGVPPRSYVGNLKKRSHFVSMETSSNLTNGVFDQATQNWTIGIGSGIHVYNY